MEKASDVYNKLKLRFVGKAEVPAKPKTDNKEEEDGEKETENTGIFLQFLNCLDSVCSLHLKLPFCRFHSSKWGIGAKEK